MTGGRGSAWFIASGARQWVLRHFRRGGFIARLSQDGYVWTGEERVRAFAEWRLLELLARRGLPVPRPVAARYQRTGLRYRCDLITQRIVDAEPLSAALARRALPEPVWRAVGATVARLHGAGVDHADLNAHNILLDAPEGRRQCDRLRSRPPARAGRVERAELAAPAALAREDIARSAVRQILGGNLGLVDGGVRRPLPAAKQNEPPKQKSGGGCGCVCGCSVSFTVFLCPRRTQAYGFRCQIVYGFDMADRSRIGSHRDRMRHRRMPDETHHGKQRAVTDPRRAKHNPIPSR